MKLPGKPLGRFMRKFLIFCVAAVIIILAARYGQR